MKMLIALLILFIGSLCMPPGNVQADNPDQVTIVADVGCQTPAIVAQDMPVFAVISPYVEKCMLISLPAIVPEKAFKMPQAMFVINDYTNYMRARYILNTKARQNKLISHQAQTGKPTIRADTKTV